MAPARGSLVLGAALLLVGACGADSGPTQPGGQAPAGGKPIATIEITPAAEFVEKGKTVAFSAVVKDATGAVLAGRTLSWSVSDTAAAAVDANGMVTGKGVGRVEVRAVAEGKSAAAQIRARGLKAPWSAADRPRSLVPMGETVYHPDSPGGHPGIDFEWATPVQLPAVLDGTVIAIEHEQLGSKVTIRSGNYLVVYGHLGSYRPELTVGARVSAGQPIGQPMKKPFGEGYVIHWEFGVYRKESNIPDRVCPENWFEAEARAAVEKVWADTRWEHKGRFPDLCNNVYKGKE